MSGTGSQPPHPSCGGELIRAEVMLKVAATLPKRPIQKDPPIRRWVVALSGPESTSALQHVLGRANSHDQVFLAHMSPNRPRRVSTDVDETRISADTEMREQDLSRASSLVKGALTQCQKYSDFCQPLMMVNPGNGTSSIAGTLAREAERVGAHGIVAGDELNPVMELDLSVESPVLRSLRPDKSTREILQFKHAAEDIEVEPESSN